MPREKAGGLVCVIFVYARCASDEYLIKLEDWGIVFFLLLLLLLSATFERLLLSVELRPSMANCRFLFRTSS